MGRVIFPIGGRASREPAWMNDTHVAQMTGYLALTALRLALLLNFKFAKLQWRRVVL